MKTGIFNAMTLIAAICVFFASCEKQMQQPQQKNTTVFTASIMNVKTTVTIEANVGKVAWEQGDAITITDASGKSAVYEAVEDGSSVEFALAEGETAVGAGPYKAFYNSEIRHILLRVYLQSQCLQNHPQHHFLFRLHPACLS